MIYKEMYEDILMECLNKICKNNECKTCPLNVQLDSKNVVCVHTLYTYIKEIYNNEKD